MIAFPLPAAAAELPAGVQQILQQSELTPDKLVHITLQELLQTLAGWLKNAWGQPLQLARRAVLFLLLSSCVGLLADGGAWRDCVDLVAVLGFGTIALNQMTSLVQQVAQAANTSQLYVSGFVPVFAGVALLAGQTAGAAVYSTMFYAMAAFLAEVLQNLLLPLLQIYFCFSVSAALWGDSGIADAANLFARCFTFALKLCGMLFTFVLGLQNVLAAGTDRAALKIGKSVLSAAVPVVGMPLRRLWTVLPPQSDCSKAHWRWRRWQPWGQRLPRCWRSAGCTGWCFPAWAFWRRDWGKSAASRSAPYLARERGCAGLSWYYISFW